MKDLFEAHADAQLGMDRVATKAGAEWIESALNYLQSYASRHERFLAEDVVDSSKGIVEEPHDRRAWGPVFNRAKRSGLIIPAGYGQAKTSNTSPKIMWRSAVYSGTAAA